MNYLEIVINITNRLANAGENDTVRLINNAKIKGGTGGEILSIICSLLKVYQNKFPDIFNLIKDEAKLLFKIAKETGMSIIPNYSLLDELDWE